LTHLAHEMNLFYHSEAALGVKVLLDPQEALHITKVFRKRDGDRVEFTDGKGTLFTAELIVEGKKTFAHFTEILRTDDSLHPLTMAVCPTKNNERLEWFVEKAVEIGIGQILLVEAEHSERVHLKLDRLNKIAVSAMKQSLKLRLPEIVPVATFSDVINECATEIKCIAHCYDTEKKLLRDAIVRNTSATILIGPEGDFSQKEVELALQKGFQPVSLGTSRLRTETAALVAVTTFDIINQ
jgi:16S rRNA (uracil1498-N3)-methyltransferase